MANQNRALRKEIADEKVSDALKRDISEASEAMVAFLKRSDAGNSIEARINKMSSELNIIYGERAMGVDIEGSKSKIEEEAKALEKERTALQTLDKALKSEKELEEKIHNATDQSARDAYQKELEKARDQKSDATKELLQFSHNSYTQNFIIGGAVISGDKIEGRIKTVGEQIDSRKEDAKKLEEKLNVEKAYPKMISDLETIKSDPEKYLKGLLAEGIAEGMKALESTLKLKNENELREYLSQNGDAFNDAEKFIAIFGDYISINAYDDMLASKLSKKVHHEMADTRRDTLKKVFGESFGVKTSTDVSQDRQNLLEKTVGKFITGEYSKWEDAGKAYALVYSIGKIGKRVNELDKKSNNLPYTATVKEFMGNKAKYTEEMEEKLGIRAKAPAASESKKEESTGTAGTEGAKQKADKINYSKEYGWAKWEMTTWVNEYNRYLESNSFAKDAAEKLKGYSEFKEQMKNNELHIDDAREIYAEVMMAKAGHDLNEEKKEKNHFNVAIKKLYEEFKKGEKDKKEITQMMYALDLAYVTAEPNNLEALHKKTSASKDDTELVEKAEKINNSLKDWIKDESEYEYERLLKELKELDEKERERIYNLLRDISGKAKVVPAPDESGSSSSTSISTSSASTTMMRPMRPPGEIPRR